MALLFLGIIYVTFISLGLPDSLLGVGWPEMYGELEVPQSYAGFLSMTISSILLFHCRKSTNRTSFVRSRSSRPL